MTEADVLLTTAEKAVQAAQRAGADSAEAFLHESQRASLTMRGEITSPKEAHTLGLCLRVAVGTRVGSAASSGTHRIDEVAAQAVKAARAGPERQSFSGFALPRRPVLSPSPVHPLIQERDPERIQRIANDLHEGLASSETTFSTVMVQNGHSRFAVVNDQGVAAWDRFARESFTMEVRVTRHGRDVTATGSATGPLPQDDRDLTTFAATVTERARAALAPKPLTRPVHEVILAPSAVGQIIARYVELFSGSLVAGGQSPLTEKLDTEVADVSFTLHDQPHGDSLPQRLRVDHEGVPTSAHVLVENGVMRSVLYDTLTAQGAGRESTGNAIRPAAWLGGVGIRPVHPFVEPGRGSLDDLIAQAEDAVLITDAMTGMFTTNSTTGDFSAAVPYAFLVKDGEIQHALPNATVGGNIQTMLRNIRAIGGEAMERRTGTFPPMHCGGVSCAT